MLVISKLSVFVVVVFILLIVMQFHYGESQNSSADELSTDLDEIRAVREYKAAQFTLDKYLVSISLRGAYGNHRHRCAGSIITPTIILSAARCLVLPNNKLIEPNAIVVIAGSPDLSEKLAGRKVFSAYEIRVHPKFSHQADKADIGLIILTDSIKEQPDHIEIIPLPKSPVGYNRLCTVIGYGIRKEGIPPEEVNYVDVRILTKNVCRERLELVTKRRLSPDMFCATDLHESENGECHNDAGGHLVCDDAVAGIMSYGLPCKDNNPLIFVDVFYYRDWILKNFASKFRVDYLSFVVSMTIWLIRIFL